MITLDPIAQPLPPVRTWIVRGAKTLPGGAVATYQGTAWGRTKEEARRLHERLLEVGRYTWELTPLESN